MSTNEILNILVGVYQFNEELGKIWLNIHLINNNGDFKYVLEIKQLAIASETFKWKMNKDFKIVDDADDEEYDVIETKKLTPKDVENMFLLRY